MYKTVIFDLDGTLLDTLDDLWAAVNASLMKYNLPRRTKEEVRSFVGNGIAKLMERAAGETDDKTREGLLAEFKRYYSAHCADQTTPYAGILELLEELRKQGIQTAVVSNKADFAVKKLADYYFKDLLLAAVGENEEAGIRKKPAPDSLLSVMKSLGASMDSTVYVGDSEVDIQTANNAGVDCISVCWGFKDREFLLQSGATNLIDKPQEIINEVIK